MTLDPAERILELLPSGEWQDVTIVDGVAGMMARRSIMLRARWLRDGGHPAFIKYILAASPTAGETTRLLTGPQRIARLTQRLTALHAAQSTIPVVPLFEVRLIEETGGLLVAMADVQTLHSLIGRGMTDAGTAIQVLEALDPKTCSPQWIHFDICPENVGVYGDGRIVLIDVESIYFRDADRATCEVTTPAWKPFRAPGGLRDELGLAFSANRQLPLELLQKKQSFEVLLAATECVIGLFKPHGDVLTAAQVDAWARDRRTDSAAKILIDAIDAAVSNRPIPSLAAIAAALRRLHTPQCSTADARNLESTLPNLASVPQGRTVAGPPRELDELADALRAGALSGANLVGYRKLLTEALAAAADRVPLRKELLLIAISFEKDPNMARTIAEEAMKDSQCDEELVRWHQIVQIWCAAR
jgi:hypothetical protein